MVYCFQVVRPSARPLRFGFREGVSNKHCLLPFLVMSYSRPTGVEKVVFFFSWAQLFKANDVVS